jgi:hypothetical protein
MKGGTIMDQQQELNIDEELAGAIEVADDEDGEASVIIKLDDFGEEEAETVVKEEQVTPPVNEDEQASADFGEEQEAEAVTEHEEPKELTPQQIKDIVHHYDTIVLDHLKLLFDGLSYERVIEPTYRVALSFVGDNLLTDESTYAQAAKLASIYAQRMLSGLLD